MFKKLTLCLVLVIALVFGPIGGGIYAMEDGQQCTLIEGARVIQILPDHSLRGVINPEELSVDIGPELTPEAITTMSRATKETDWQGAHMGIVMVDLGAGPFPCVIVVKPQYVKDCK